MKKNNLSKFLSMTIAFALVFSSMNMTVFADEAYQEEALREDLNENSDIEDESKVIICEPEHDAEGTIPEPEHSAEETVSEPEYDDAEETTPKLDSDTEDIVSGLEHDTEPETNWEKGTEGIGETVGDEDVIVSEKTAMQESESIVASGLCGEKVTWTFYDDGLLRILGTGSMITGSSNIPWEPYAEMITRLEIGDGVTSIGDCAFWHCNLLAGELIIPDSVTSIGQFAFCNCKNLSKMFIPKSVKSIGDFALECLDIYYDGSLSEWNVIEKSKWALSKDTIVHIVGCNIVKFDSGQGSKVLAQPVENGQLMVEPEKPKREGYNFTGWYTSLMNQTDETKWDFDTDTVTEDITLYAGWSNAEIIVYLDANGGQLEETSTRQITDTYYKDLPTPTRYGYTFEGWAYGGELISTESKVQCSDSYIIYARWKANTYCVKFNPTGGSISIESQIVEYDSRYNYLPIPRREGYEFCGWFTKEIGGTKITRSSKVTLAEDHILYAHWMGETYSVTFDVRGGEVSTDTAIVINGMEYGVLPVPTKDNFIFLGWYTELEGGTQIKEEDEVFISSDITLYAHWQGDERTVYFDANGGKVDTTSLKVYYNVKFGTLPVPEREGYTFIGWFTEMEKGDVITEESTANLESNLTLYAHWKINEYTVVLHANGGSFGTSDIVSYTIEHGNTIVQYNEPILYLQRIVKWTDAFGQEYQINEPIVSNLELYAQWEKKYTVAKPTANVKAGQIAVGTRITLSTATNGAEIYYTLDGTLPTAESCLYDDAIVIDADTTINAIAVKEDYNTSDNVSFTYTVKDESDSWGDITDEDKDELRKSGIMSADQVPASFWVAGISDREYTGKAITFENIHVYYHKTLLRPDSDYTVKYANNINASSSTGKRAPSVTIIGKGNYSDRITKTFSIHKLSLGNGETNSSRLTALNITLTNTGKVQKGTTVVTYDINGNSVVLKVGKDFTYSYSDASYGAYENTGEYIVTLTGKGNFTGTATFKEIISADKKLLGKMSFAKVAEQAATGSAVEPDIVIKDGEYILQKEKDYTLSYQNNINVGTAHMLVTGIGDYSGTKMVSFKIRAVAMKKVSVSGIKAKDYTGREIIQTGYVLTYKADNAVQDEVLSEGRDYTVSYTNNIKAGKNKAMVLFTGKGRFSGTIKVKFSINTRSIQDADVAPSDFGIVAYQKKGAKPEITVTVDDTVLKENTDYIVKYSNNTDVNDGSDSNKVPTVKVTGKGNYSGTVLRTFKIGPGSLENTTMTATDIVYRNKGGICKPNVKIVDANGCPLAAGTDYYRTLTYTYNTDTIIQRAEVSVIAQEGDLVDSKDIIPVGAEIKVTATGINKYAGSTISTTFRYIAADLSKATVKIPDQTFTGDYIELGKDQITVKINNSILQNNDYEIAGYSQNRDKGVAAVTLRGIGNYGGTKRVTFKIVNRSMYYTVIFDANGGNGNMKQMRISADSANLTANKIKRAGAVFKGWNTRKDGLGTFYADKQTVYSKDNLGKVLKLYAQWDIINYLITYDTNGGINSEKNPSAYNVTSGAINLYAPTKEHCTFAGWYKERNFKTKVTVIKAGSTGDLILYAKWVPVKYNIVFNENGGSGYLEDMTGLSYGKSYTLKKNKYSRTGYSFANWNTKADGSGTSYKNQDSVMNLGEQEGQCITLYAMWDMDTYSISYELDGGINNNNNPTNYTVVTDNILLRDPKKDYYLFDGWYKESKHKNRITSIPKGSAGNLKLYASWIPYQYEVVFDGNGNTGGNMSAKTYKYGTSYTLPANGFKKKNYRFIGWNTSADGTGVAYKNKASIKNLVTENNGSITLYAQWKYVPPKTVNITPTTKSVTVPKGYDISVTADKYIYSYNLYKNGRLYESESWNRTDEIHKSFPLRSLPAGTYTIYVHTCSFRMRADLMYSEDRGFYYKQYYEPTYENTHTYKCKITIE